ncbi:hypothetical protein AG1IA_02978 [Rhizoctonia solani AG-1 IA]|uniref:Uncharacterized protein n=1 Tax=Thanatephorus cucumeris (strain AG1-IA) TaxID=983506 RepID=L8WYA5_THACA|nr:hypothetical protein AG1IA_02978 [Rhizoctonia solani AG-1 IA]
MPQPTQKEGKKSRTKKGETHAINPDPRIDIKKSENKTTVQGRQTS